MKIAFVSSEVFPFAKTGGLGDVSCSLPMELSKFSVDTKVFMPKYYHIDEKKFNLQYIWTAGGILIHAAGKVYPVQFYKGKLPNSNIDIYFVDSPHHFHRFNIYTNDKDEDERFLVFNKAVIEFIQRIQWKPDIIHCNDWQTGILPLLVKENYNWDRSFDRTAYVFTIHNVAYQGRFSPAVMEKAGLSRKYFYPTGPVEYYGDFSFLKTGICFSEVVNTVSETYAKELLTPEYGEGMQDVLKAKGEDFSGILNGVDYNVWNPDTDRLIHFNYSSADMTCKSKNKKFLLEQHNLEFNENIPLIGIVSRLATQKGFDIFMDAIHNLEDLNAQWVVLGSGEGKYENMFRQLSEQYPDKFIAHIGFNNQLSHQIEAASDIFLMPSHFEPCGLNQIYSLKYGTIPVVRKTGGLADTVQDWDEYNYAGLNTGSGFSFNDYSSSALESSVIRAVNYFHNKKTWKQIQQNGMMKDYSWKTSAEKYLKLYYKAIQKRNGK